MKILKWLAGAALLLLGSCAAPLPAFAANPNLSVGVGGEVTLLVKHGDGTTTEIPKFHNLVVNQGLDAMMGLPRSGYVLGFASGIIVSTNNSAPLASDTTVTGGLAAKAFDYPASSTAVSVVAPYHMRYNTTTTFAVGAVVGNVCKIATTLPGPVPATSTLISTSALVRVSGVPACITVLATDQLVVVYQYSFIVAADITGTSTVTIDGTPSSFNWTARPINIRTVGNVKASAAYSNISEPFGLGPSNSDHRTRFVASNALCDVTATNCPGTEVTYSGIAPCVTYVAGSFTLTCTLPLGTGAARTIGNWNVTKGPLMWQFVYSTAPMIKSADQSYEQKITFSIAAIPDP